MVRVHVDVVQDTVCPWCYIGKKRLESAIAELKETDPEIQVDVSYHPHFLSVELLRNPQSSVPKSQVYLKRFNGSQKAVDKMVAQFEHMFRECGIEYKFVGNMSTSLHAHRLSEWVGEEYGEHAKADMVEALFKKYHTQGQTLNELSTLLSAVRDLGLDETKAKKFLESDRGTKELMDKILNQRSTFQSLTGVPHYRLVVDDNAFELPGAQDVSFFTKTIRRMVEISKRPRL